MWVEEDAGDRLGSGEFLKVKLVLESFCQIEIEITATPNLPVEVYTVGRYLDSILKGVFIEYINKLPNFRIRDMHGVKMVIEFDQRLEALNLKITSPLDTTVFRNIRLPFWMRQILPLHHST